MKILRCEMYELLQRLKSVKEFYDDGGKKIVVLFSEYDEDWEMYESNAYEDFMSLSEVEDMTELYYDEEEPLGDDEYRESYGEAFLLANEDMQEYYRLLKRAKRLKKITKKEYALMMNEMEKMTLEYIIDPQYTYNCGVYCEILYGKTVKDRTYIEIQVDYNCYVDYFLLTAGVVTLFEKYTQKLKELKEKYFEEKTKLEAA